MATPSEAETRIIDGLNALLADAAVFRYKVQNYHWNVRGRQFFELHDQFEELYTEWTTHLDDIAERVRAKEAAPLPTLARCLERTHLAEEEGTPDAKQMVDFQQRNIYWNTMEFTKVAQRLKVTRLVIIDLSDYRMHEPGNVNIWKGHVSANVSVDFVDADFFAEIGEG